MRTSYAKPLHVMWSKIDDFNLQKLAVGTVISQHPDKPFANYEIREINQEYIWAVQNEKKATTIIHKDELIVKGWWIKNEILENNN